MENNKLLEEKGYIQIKRIQIILHKQEESFHSSLTPIEESSNENQKESSSADVSSKRTSKSSNRLSLTSVVSISENEEEEKTDSILNKNLCQSSIEIPKFIQNITEPMERLDRRRNTEKPLLPPQEMPKSIQPPKNLAKEPKQKKKQQPSKVSAETNLPSISDIEGNVLEIAMNQSGSRTLQRFVEKANQQEIEIVLMEILPYLERVIRDDYANYMFQAICLRCTPKMRLTIVKAIAGDIVSLAMHKKGTHSLQALISAMNTESEAVIFMTLIASHVSKLSKDGHGTYFIQKIIFCFSNKVVRALLEIVLGDFEAIVCNQYGVCVIKAIINKYCGNNSQEQSYIIKKIVDNMDELIQDPFGNYAVKQILDKCDFLSVQNIVIRVLEKFLCLSLQKFSSYIVEKCLILFYKDIKECIQDFVNEEIISELSNNNYGCHVLKTMVECMAGFDRQSLIYVGSCAYSIIKTSQNSTQKEFLVKIVQFIQKF